MKLKIIGLLIILLAALAILLFVSEAKGEYHYDGKMQLATEYLSPGEDAATQNLINTIEAVLDRVHPTPERMRRDAHIKQHGLLKAEFEVLGNFDKQYQIGLFKTPKTYEAWARFSNNFDKPDFEKNTRGMAVKLLGVDGQKILPSKTVATTHDFVFMSQQYFPTKDAISFSELIDARQSGNKSMFRYLVTHPRVAIKFLLVDTVSPDLLSIVWGSATPYALGDDMAVKYVAKPRIMSTAEMPTGKISPDFLRERLIDKLNEEDILIDFYIQPQLDPETMPIEDARVVWDEKDSPHIKVATIRIPKQSFDTPAQHLYGDQLSYSPWHALPEHRPLGGINRARKAVYIAISKFRHDRNGEVSVEPTNWVDFEKE